MDGLRLDAVHAYFDRSAIHFLEQLATEMRTTRGNAGRRMVLIAESDLNDPRMVTAREGGGYGMDAQWSDDFHHALFTVLTTVGRGKGYYVDFGSMAKLAKALTRDICVGRDDVFAAPRAGHGRPVEDLSPHQFLGFIQNHDQVGNRAMGERLQENMGMERAKVAAAIVLTAPFIPMIFQGEEWAASTPFQYFADHQDAALAKAVSEGRKKEFEAFGWNPDHSGSGKARDVSAIEVELGRSGRGDHARMLAWYRELIRLRRSTAA